MTELPRDVSDPLANVERLLDRVLNPHGSENQIAAREAVRLLLAVARNSPRYDAMGYRSESVFALLAFAGSLGETA